ncbi:MAG: ComEC/Rec2-related protein, partial [Thermomicrobiales bacterium]|nr:ComEC/Rec2-related protein [Thermomicrobiales bacterium]
MTGIAAGTAALTGTALGWWGAVLVSLLAVLALATLPRRAPRAVCAVAVAAVVLGAWRAETLPAPAEGAALVPNAPTTVVVTVPVVTGQRQHFAVETSVGDGLPADGLPARVCVSADPFPIVHLGDVLHLEGTMEVATDLSRGFQAAISARGCLASLSATSLRVIGSSPSVLRTFAGLRTRLSSVLRRSAPGDAGVLLSGLVTGDDGGFSPERKNAFLRTGTTHLTAVSGSNLALIAGILATIGSATLGRHRLPWQFVTIMGVWAYALISGTHPPSLRAAIVVTAAVIAFRVGRRPDFVTLILLAAGTMVVLDPRQIASLGFQLSVTASLALAFVLTGLMARFQPSRLGVVLTATVAAQLATLPVLLPTFGAVSLTSLPANMIAVPLAAIAMPLAALAAIAGLVWLPLGEVIAAPAVLLATALIGAVDALGAPQAYISVGLPPLPAAVVVAIAVLSVLTVIAGNEVWGRLQPAQPHLSRVPHSRRSAPLLPSSTAILAGEDPLDALAADLDEAKEQPTGQEVGHE